MIEATVTELPLAALALPLAVDGLAVSGYFILALGLLCAGLGFYLRKQAQAAPAAPAPDAKKKKGKKKGGKSKKNKKQSEAKPKPKNEGGSLIWGGLGFAALGVVMIVAGLMKS